jgi:hypothetical protein
VCAAREVNRKKWERLSCWLGRMEKARGGVVKSAQWNYQLLMLSILFVLAYRCSSVSLGCPYIIRGGSRSAFRISPNYTYIGIPIFSSPTPAIVNQPLRNHVQINCGSAGVFLPSAPRCLLWRAGIGVVIGGMDHFCLISNHPCRSASAV